MHTFRHSFVFVVLAIVPWGLIIADPTTPATAAKKKPTTKKRITTAKTGASKKGTTTVRQPYRPRQSQPTPERYKEIQQALASKGYLRTEPTGEWSSASAEALKRFQAEQNLSPDGKLTSLSLIALGLGPKRLSPQAAAPVEVESPRADPTK